jgi:hypothetical protein
MKKAVKKIRNPWKIITFIVTGLIVLSTTSTPSLVVTYRGQSWVASLPKITLPGTNTRVHLSVESAGKTLKGKAGKRKSSALKTHDKPVSFSWKEIASLASSPFVGGKSP